MRYILDLQFFGTGSCTDCTGYCNGCSSACVSSGCTGCGRWCGGCTGVCVRTCADDCVGTCSGGCSGGCSSSCSGGCKGGCSNCGGCDTGCNSACTNNCAGYCNAGCSGGQMAETYSRVNGTLSTLVMGSEIKDVRELLLHELNRFGLLGVKAQSTDTDVDNIITYGTIDDVHTGLEINNNITTLKNIATKLLNNSILSKDEIETCKNYILVSYETSINLNVKKGTYDKISVRSDGTTFDESTFNPWA